MFTTPYCTIELLLFSRTPQPHPPPLHHSLPHQELCWVQSPAMACGGEGFAVRSGMDGGVGGDGSPPLTETGTSPLPHPPLH